MNNLAPIAASSAVVHATASTVSTASAIPYRKTSLVSLGGMVGASFIVAFVLVALVCFLIYARRRGWTGMGVIAMNRIPSDEGLSVITTKRLSMASVGYVVAYRGNEYLIVESGKGFQTQIAPLHSRENLQGEKL